MCVPNIISSRWWNKKPAPGEESLITFSSLEPVLCSYCLFILCVDRRSVVICVYRRPCANLHSPMTICKSSRSISILIPVSHTCLKKQSTEPKSCALLWYQLQFFQQKTFLHRCFKNIFRFYYSKGIAAIKCFCYQQCIPPFKTSIFMTSASRFAYFK